MVSENGNGTATQPQQVKTILGIPCEGCTNRAQIMGAGDWKIDAIILGSIALLVLGILFYKSSLADGA